MGGGAAIVAALLIFLATQPPGPGLDPDAMAYVGAATSLVQRGVFRVPTGEWSRRDSTTSLSLWPPGYPVAMAGVMAATGGSPIQSGRIVNIVAAAVTAATLFGVVTTAAGSAAAGVVMVVVAFVTEAVFDVHLSILSEPLFLAFLTLTVATMAYARDRLLLLGSLATAAVMTRYVGGCAPAAVVVWTLTDNRFAFGRRLRRAAVVALLPAVVLGAWVVRTALVPDRYATPHVAVYGHWDMTLRQAGETLASWLVPLVPEGTVQGMVAVVLGLLLTGAILATLRDTRRSRYRAPERLAGASYWASPGGRAAAAGTLLRATLVMTAWYLVVLCASRLLVGGTIPFDWRILAPVILLLELAIVVAAVYWWRAYHRPIHVVLVLIALVWAAASATVTVNDAIAAATDGSDFAGTEWRESPLLAWVRGPGRRHTLYSNWPPAVYFHTGRIARELPDSTETREELSDFATALRGSNGVIVGFAEPSPDVIAPDSLAALLGLHAIARYPDGIIWSP